MSRWTVSTFAWMRAISASAASSFCARRRAGVERRDLGFELQAQRGDRLELLDRGDLLGRRTLDRIRQLGGASSDQATSGRRDGGRDEAEQERSRDEAEEEAMGTHGSQASNTSHTATAVATWGTSPVWSVPILRLAAPVPGSGGQTRRKRRSPTPDPTAPMIAPPMSRPDADRGGVAGGDVEALEEALGRLELAKQVLEPEDAADGEPGADAALHQAFGHERDADEPVRRADELHHLDLAAAGERGEPDRVHDEEQRRRDQHERDRHEHVAEEVGDRR